MQIVVLYEFAVANMAKTKTVRIYVFPILVFWYVYIFFYHNSDYIYDHGGKTTVILFCLVDSQVDKGAGL